MDSGIRGGADVLKAIALGAKAVLLGRPYLYGLAVAGEKGVNRVITNLISDIDLSLANTGRNSISEIDRSLLVHATRDSFI
jgi:isopentenyl diphosphate isomerase/L-lactate dehydrogenase-like FMN-dependent dehydrogenase